MEGTNRGLLRALGRIGIVCGVAIAFILGLTGTVYLLSLRNAEVKVPDILGKNYLAGEEMLGGAGLNIRKRASRFAPDTKPDMILDQSPRAGEMVKAGQTIAVVISRPPKEGESVPPPDENAATTTGKAETSKPIDNTTNDNAASKNQNNDKNRRQDKDTRNKNANSKSGANVNNGNANNRNTNNRNRNSNNGYTNSSNRNASNLNANNRNASNRPTNANINRGINNLNANKRVPPIGTPPFNSNGNTRKP